MNNDVLAIGRLHATGCIDRQRLERARRRRAHGDDPSACLQSVRQRLRRGWRHRVELWIHFVLVDVLHSDWLERSVADVQRERDPLDAACPQLVEHAVREVKSRRRRRHRSRLACVHGLIAVAV